MKISYCQWEQDWLITLFIIFYLYHFVRTILSVPFCPIPFCPYTIYSIPFCPYHFVRCHFVRSHFTVQKPLLHPRASIWFEIWGSWIRVNKISIFPGKFRNISIFPGNLKKISISQAKIAHLQLLLGKLFYFSSKVTTFEHSSCT